MVAVMLRADSGGGLRESRDLKVRDLSGGFFCYFLSPCTLPHIRDLWHTPPGANATQKQ